MKSLKKTLVLLVVLSMILTVVAPVFAFTDELGNYEEQVNKMVALGVLNGYAEDGTFRAEGNITRAEMAKVICIITGSTQALADASKSTPSRFSDVPAGEWYTGWVNIATGSGIINGFPDGTFRPAENLTVNQALTLVVKALGRGAFVDQLGSWPGNYVQDAAKLGITKDMIVTGSELANRGNVAIICWNALTVGVWDVTSTTLAGEVTLSNFGTGTLLSNYFKDFSNDEGELKLVENVQVTATPLQMKDFGERQIRISDMDDAEFEGANLTASIDAEKKPSRNSETATYTVNADNVVVYVPTEAYANVASLFGKKVDILFGKNNVAALIVVVDETVNNAYVTAWDYNEAEIEVDGETYEVAEDVQVSVFGTILDLDDGEPATDIDDLDAILETAGSLGVTNATRTFDRKVIANIILNSDNEVASIDLMFSETSLTVGPVTITEGIVESLPSTGVIRFVDTNLFGTTKIKDIEDDDNPRVIKNGALISLEDIEVGDVVTVVSVGGDYDMVYVSSNKATGTISAIKNGNVTIDGKVYYTITTPIGDTNGDIEDATDITSLVAYFDEEVEAYINYFGEISALVATTDATDSTLGVVTRDASIKVDENDIDYISLRIMTSDGTKASYKIYNKNSSKSIDEAAEYGDDFDEEDLVVGTLVVFSAADGKIKSDDIVLAEDGEEYTIDTKELDIIELPAEFAFTDLDPVEAAEAGEYFYVNDDNKTITIATFAENDEEIADGTAAATYRFSTTTVLYNTDDDALEIISGWDALCAEDDTHGFAEGNFLVFDSNKRVRYFAGDVSSYESQSDNYAVLVDVSITKDEDDETVYVATLFVDGEEVSYELADGDELDDVEEGDFIKYTLTDNEIDSATVMVAVWDLEALDLDDAVGATIAAAAESADADTLKQSLTVREVDGDLIFYTDEVLDADEDPVAELAELVLEEDGYIIYDLRNGSWTMIDDIEDIVHALVIGFISETDNDVDILVVVE